MRKKTTLDRWEWLEKKLEQAHNEVNPTTRAIDLVDTWIVRHKATLLPGPDIDRIINLCIEYGYLEGFSRERLRNHLQAAKKPNFDRAAISAKVAARKQLQKKNAEIAELRDLIATLTARDAC